MGEQLHLLPVATNLLEASNLTNVLEELEGSLHLEESGQRTLDESGYREGHREDEEPCPRVVELAGHRVVEVQNAVRCNDKVSENTLRNMLPVSTIISTSCCFIYRHLLCKR